MSASERFEQYMEHLPAGWGMRIGTRGSEAIAQG